MEQPAAAEARARGQDSGALCAACATCPPIHQPTAPPPPQTTTTGGVRLQLQALTLLISSRHAWLPPEAGCAKRDFLKVTVLFIYFFKVNDMPDLIAPPSRVPHYVDHGREAARPSVCRVVSLLDEVVVFPAHFY